VAAAPTIHVTITEAPIDPAPLFALAAAPENGAVNVFLGVTRDHHDGRPVTGLEYHCYRDMALAELRRVSEAAAAAHGLTKLIVIHRVGVVAIGETSLAIAAGAHHRKQALLGTLDLIDALKRDVPIWKRESFADGSTGWVEGAAILPAKA
jgi:molybdopterin synthase catalytic subunit